MSLQTTLKHYFSSRKRHAVDDIKKGSEKVLILDKNELEKNEYKDVAVHQRTIIYKESPKSSTGKSNAAPKLRRRTPKTVSRSFITSGGENAKSKSSAKKSLLQSFNSSDLDMNKKESLNKTTAKKSLLSSFDASSSTEECKKLENSKSKADTAVNLTDKTSPSVESGSTNVKSLELSEKTSVELIKETEEIHSNTSDNKKNKSFDKLKNFNKDLDLGTIKKKLIRSSRLEDLKNALKRVNEGHSKLKEIQSRNNQTTPTKSPTLKQFKAIELDVPASPSKMTSTTECVKVPDSPSLLRRAVFLSPSKTAPNTQPYISPKKLFSDSFNSALQRSPGTSPNKQRSFERFYALASSGKPSFTLPYHYRALAETYRSGDTVVSIMQNRSETILFSKLKASVQQLTKKNLLESHLGQIATIFPKAYTFVQERVRVLGNQHETYELVIKPVFGIRDGKDNVKDLMTPSLLLEFLKSLDPPLVVPKDKLTRWHPAFDVESCPEIKATSLPQPPNIEKYTTARDVLNKARDKFVANPRMEKALERLSESSTNTSSTSKSIPALANALKGIPKSLLEKVRARQAAKAMELLTRNPSENKRRYELTRLPELARILRNIFVTEKKNIMTKPIIIEKMCESYREIMDKGEMEHHLDLLREVIPGWIIVSLVDKKKFVKLCKKTDLSEVLAKINTVVQKNSLNF